VRRGWTHRQGWTKPVRVYALAPSAVCRTSFAKMDRYSVSIRLLVSRVPASMNEIGTWAGFSRDASSPDCVTPTSLSGSCPCNVFPMIEKNHEVGNSEQEHLHCRPRQK
jgi:hypothetical protein